MAGPLLTRGKPGGWNISMDGNPLSAVFVTNPEHGADLTREWLLSYPARNTSSGAGYVQLYRARDGTATGGVATVTITITIKLLRAGD